MTKTKAHDEVYLLVKREETKFKIGVSRNVSQRVNQISDAKEIDFENSYLIKVENNQAYKLEKILHYTFEHKKTDGDKPDGKTEWFNKDCLKDVVLFLHEMMRRKPKGFIEIINGINYNEIVKKTKEPFALVAEIQVSIKRIRRMRAFLKKNRKAIVGRGINEFKQDCFYIAKITNRGDPAISLLFSIFSLWCKNSTTEGGAIFIGLVEGREKGGAGQHVTDQRHFFMNILPDLKNDLDLLWQDVENIKLDVKEMERISLR